MDGTLCAIRVGDLLSISLAFRLFLGCCLPPFGESHSLASCEIRTREPGNSRRSSRVERTPTKLLHEGKTNSTVACSSGANKFQKLLHRSFAAALRQNLNLNLNNMRLVVGKYGKLIELLTQSTRPFDLRLMWLGAVLLFRVAKNGQLTSLLVLAAVFVICCAQIPPWDCPVIKPRYPPPQNVNDLNPADVKVVMAVGDSISAGFAMVCLCRLIARFLTLNIAYKVLGRGFGGVSRRCVQHWRR